MGVLTALQDLPASIWVPILWAMLGTLEQARAAGLHADYGGQILTAAIAQELAALDQTPARGAPDR